MGRINVSIPDDLEKELRRKIIERYGGRRGDLTKAVTEAVKLWIEEGKANKG